MTWNEKRDFYFLKEEKTKMIIAICLWPLIASDI